MKCVCKFVDHTCTCITCTRAHTLFTNVLESQDMLLSTYRVTVAHHTIQSEVYTLSYVGNKSLIFKHYTVN